MNFDVVAEMLIGAVGSFAAPIMAVVTALIALLLVYSVIRSTVR